MKSTLHTEQLEELRCALTLTPCRRLTIEPHLNDLTPNFDLWSCCVAGRNCNPNHFSKGELTVSYGTHNNSWASAFDFWHITLHCCTAYSNCRTSIQYLSNITLAILILSKSVDTAIIDMTYRYTEHPQLHFTILHSTPSTSPKLISSRVPRRLAISARFSSEWTLLLAPLQMSTH